MRMCLKSWNRREFQFELLHPNLSWKRLVVYSIHVLLCTACEFLQAPESYKNVTDVVNTCKEFSACVWHTI